MSPPQECGLPEGTYRISVVSRPPSGGEPTRIEKSQVRLELDGWTPERIDKNTEILAGYSRSYSLLVQPQDGGQSVGFREVTGSQLEALRRDGLEPALVVKVGERHDLWLKAHARLTEVESRELSKYLEGRYGLTPSRGVLGDAVRLPGCEAVPGKAETRAVAVLAREAPFSSSMRLLTALRDRDERIEIAHLARARPVAEEITSSSVAHLMAQAEANPRLPAAHPVARLEALLGREVDRFVGDPTLDGATRDPLLGRGHAANEAVLRELSHHPLDEVSRLPVFRELVAVEHQLFDHSNFRELRLQATEEFLAKACYEVSSSTREAARNPGAESTDRLRQAVHEARKLGDQCRGEMRDFARGREAQGELGLARLVAAVAMTPRDARVLAAFECGAEQQARLILRNGGTALPAELAAGAPAELRGSLETLRQREASLVADLQKGPDREAALRALPAVILERVEIEQRVRLLELSQPVAASRLADHAATVTAPEPAQRQVIAHCRELAGWNLAQGPPPESGSLTALRDAALRVEQGDVSPRALGQLVSEVVRELGPAGVPAPPPAPPGEGVELLRRFASLEGEIRQLAAEKHPIPEAQGDALRRLGEHAVALIQVHQAAETLERRLHGVAEPGAPEPGISWASWDRAWMERANEKGLPMPERHLANLGSAFAPRELDFERAFSLAKLEGSAMRSVTKELEKGVSLR